jgi:hypothetical protein
MKKRMLDRFRQGFEDRFVGGSTESASGRRVAAPLRPHIPAGSASARERIALQLQKRERVLIAKPDPLLRNGL